VCNNAQDPWSLYGYWTWNWRISSSDEGRGRRSQPTLVAATTLGTRSLHIATPRPDELVAPSVAIFVPSSHSLLVWFHGYIHIATASWQWLPQATPPYQAHRRTIFRKTTRRSRMVFSLYEQLAKPSTWEVFNSDFFFLIALSQTHFWNILEDYFRKTTWKRWINFSRLLWPWTIMR